MSEDPTDTLELLATRLVEVEEQLARQTTWTLVGLLGMLGVTLLLFAAASFDTASAQRQTAVLLRVCSVGAARMGEGRAAYCERYIHGFRLARAPIAEQAAAVDSLEQWAQARGWAPPPTTTIYPEPPE